MISEFPLFMFTTLGGLAAGAYAASAVFPVGKDSKKAWLFPLACLILLAVGLAFLPAHLGRPERMLAALTHPGAMIAQEAYWSAALAVVLIIDIVMAKTKGAAPRALRIIGAIVGVVLMVIMANAYFVSYGVAAWASWQVFPLYVLGERCGGSFTYLENGYKDCRRCLYPHDRGSYDAIMKRYGEILAVMASRRKEENQ